MAACLFDSISISGYIPQMTQIIADKFYANICVVSDIRGIKFTAACLVQIKFLRLINGGLPL
jgi:hypothetical protein